MDDPRIAGLHFHRGDVLVFEQSSRQHVAAERVAAAGPELEVVAGRQHQIGFAELPAFGEPLGGRRMLRVSCWGAAIHPGGECGDLWAGQSSFVVKRRAVHRLPGRHLPRLRIFLNVARPVACLFVGHQRKRPNGPRAMAALAVILQDGQHIAVIRYGPLGLGRLLFVDRTTDRAHRRLADGLAGQEFIEGLVEIVAGDLQVLLEPGGVAIDADFLAHPQAIQRLMPAMGEPSVAIAQAPHHFYNDDPVMRSLGQYDC